MANWVTIGTTNLDNNRGTVGYVYLQYDSDSTGGTTWPCRLYAGEKSGAFFNVNFNSVVMDGQNLGNHSGITKNTVVATWSSTGGRSISGSWTCPWDSAYGGTRSYTISGSLPSKGQAPTGVTVHLLSVTDTSVRLSADVSNYGSPASAYGRYIEVAVLGSTTYGAPYKYYRMVNDEHVYSEITNSSDSSGADFSIVGNTEYRYGALANNTSYSTSVIADSPLVTLPAYITGISAVYTGNNTVNIATQHAAEGSALTVYTEYSWDGVTWTTVSDPFNVTITSQKRIYLRRFSDAGATPIFEATINTNNGPQLYGSVSGLSKNLSPLYATFGNYFDGHHVLTGRESYVSTDISGDDIMLAKVSSGSSSYNWVAYPIDATDELINKQVILSGEFTTSGNFTSGPRLWWLNSANTNILSGPVASIEYIGNSGKFSVSGTIPARPSGAGKLALLLYSNIASAAQGVYTVYNNVELKANVKNMFNYLSPRSIGGLTTTLAADGTLTVTGVLSANYQTIVNHIIITDLLEDGAKYTLSAANGATTDMCLELRGRKTGTTTYSYWNTRASASTTVTIDKTTYDQYAICVVTSTTASWGTESKTVSNKFQLEKGGTATSFAPFVDTKSHKLKKVYGSVDGRSKLIYSE